MKLLIVLPARNEAQNIGGVLHRILQLYPALPVLVINDASTDDTSAVARSFRDVSVIDLPFWMGYGGALQAGYKYALQHGFEGIIQMDADGQHDPLSIADLREALRLADVVVGSRFLKPGHSYVMSRTRRLGCTLLSRIAKILTGITITDPTSGFQALGIRALKVAAEDHYPLDYPDVDVIILMHRYDLKVIEIPVQMHPAGDSPGMHEGLQVWYYAIKMLLSVFVMMLRRI